MILRRDTDTALLSLALDALDDADEVGFLRAVALVRDLRRRSAWEIAAVALGYHYAGHAEESRELFRLALLKGPNDPVVLTDYGRYLYEAEQDEESIRCLECAVATHPDHPTPQAWLGDAYAATGDVEKARERYEASLALRTYADRGGALSRLAHLEAYAENWDAAAALWREALECMPRDEQTWYNLGHVLTKAGRYGEAIRALKRSVRLGNSVPEWSLGDMALCYEGLGDRRRALRFVQKALEQAPDDKDLLELRSRLQGLRP